MKNKLFIKLIFILLIVFKLSNTLAQDFEVSPAIMRFHAEPGESKSVPLNIINHSNKKSSFVIILNDFIVNKEGRKMDMPAASTEHSLANWISINPPFVELNPNEHKQIIISIQAPVGDYTTKWASLFIRSTKEQTATLADKTLQTGLMVLGQIVVYIYQSPKSNMNYKMKINQLKEISTLNDSIRVFSANIDNIGDKITKCQVTLLASNLSTGKELKLDKISLETFPDTQQTIKLKIKKDALPAGKYSLAAILDYGKQSNLEGTQMIINVQE